mgnify:CR=1 FL=1
MNLFEQQAANRRKSRWLILVFLLFFAWLGLGGDYLLWQYTLDAPRGEYRHTFPWAGVVLALIAAGRDVSYARIDSQLGHDDFLMPIPQYHAVLRNYLDRVAVEVSS